MPSFAQGTDPGWTDPDSKPGSVSESLYKPCGELDIFFSDTNHGSELEALWQHRFSYN